MYWQADRINRRKYLGERKEEQKHIAEVARDQSPRKPASRGLIVKARHTEVIERKKSQRQKVYVLI